MMATATKKQPKVIVTPRQKKAAQAVVENSRSPQPKTLGKVLTEVGYPENTAIKPTQVTESKGFKQALDDMGLTDELIVNALVEDIKMKRGRRTAELALASKIKGLDRGGQVEPPAPIAPGTTNTQNNFYLGGDEMRENYTKFVEQQTREIIENDNA